MSLFKTRQQITEEYGINRKILVRRLKQASIILLHGNLFHKNQQDIYEYFGLPPSLMSQIATKWVKEGHINQTNIRFFVMLLLA